MKTLLLLLTSILAASTLVGGFNRGKFSKGYIIEGRQLSRNGRSYDKHGGGKDCYDIFEYGPIKYKNQKKQCCKPTKRRECQTVTSDKVCINVTESRCNIHLYLECKTIMTSTKFPSDKKVKVSFTPKNCTVIEETVYHKKPKPKCVTEERENCVEAWKTLANGTQVKEKTDNCRVFKWENCTLVPTDVPFTVPKSYCTDRTDLKEEYETCQKEDETITTSKKICEVKSVPSCKSEVVKKCDTLEYEECKDVVDIDQDCEPKVVREPFQDPNHKQFCLKFHDNEQQIQHDNGHHHDHEKHQHHDHDQHQHHDQHHGHDNSDTDDEDYDNGSVIDKDVDLNGLGDPFSKNLFRGDVNKVDDSNPDGELYASGKSLYGGDLDKVDDSDPRGAMIVDDSNPSRARIVNYKVARPSFALFDPWSLVYQASRH